MRVIIDSNQVIHKDWFLSGAAFKELLQECHSRHIDLIIPQIVFDEITNKYREELLQVQRDLEKVTREAAFLRATLDYESFDEGRIDHLLAEYKNRLNKVIELYSVNVAPYSSVDHATVVRRALDRRKPFDAKGHNGYRDTLLWMSVLQGAADGKVVFVSDNWADFARSKQAPDKLADDLVKDLMAAGYGTDRVTLFTSVSELVKSWSVDAGQLQQSLQERLNSDQAFRDELEVVLRTVILDQANLHVDLLWDVEGEVDEALPENVYNFYMLEVKSVRKFAEDEYLIELFAETDVDLAVTERLDPEPGDHGYQFNTISVTKTLDFKFEAGYSGEAFENVQMIYP